MITRLSTTATPGRNYGDFSGKEEAAFFSIDQRFIRILSPKTVAVAGLDDRLILSSQEDRLITVDE